MRAMQHIPVDRKAGAAAFEAAVRALKDGEVVGVFPEATISTSFTVKDLKAGVARMAVQSGVPIIPAAVWGGHRVATKGHKVDLAPRRAGHRRSSASRSSPSRGRRPSRCCGAPGPPWRRCSTRRSAPTPTQPAGPDDRWWLPAHLGGTAPTPEEAAADDAIRAAGKRPKTKKPSPVARLKAPGPPPLTAQRPATARTTARVPAAPSGVGTSG